MLANCFAKDGPIGRNELNNIVGEAALSKNFVDQVVREDCRVTWLPESRIAHHRRGTGEVTTNGSEVEGGNGSDEALSSSVEDSVCDSDIGRERLRGFKLESRLGVESEEIDQLASGVDLSLKAD